LFLLSLSAHNTSLLDALSHKQDMSNVVAEDVVLRQYECFEPTFSRESCRARKNIYISEQTTADLIPSIDEKFADSRKLYFFFDYIVAMQIVDGQAKHFHFTNGAEDIAVIPTELHRQGKLLYAVVVGNDVEVRQQWKTIAFLTADDLRERYGILQCDLPVGSHTVHHHFADDLARIVISENVIRSTKWAQIDIHHRPKTQKPWLNFSRFARSVLRALRQRDNDKWVAMANIKHNAYAYHIEKVLPVWLSERKQFVGVAFRIDCDGSTKVCGIHFDLPDVENKANLIDIERAQTMHWLPNSQKPCQERRASSAPAAPPSWHDVPRHQIPMVHSQSVPDMAHNQLAPTAHAVQQDVQHNPLPQFALQNQSPVILPTQALHAVAQQQPQTMQSQSALNSAYAVQHQNQYALQPQLMLAIPVSVSPVPVSTLPAIPQTPMTMAQLQHQPQLVVPVQSPQVMWPSMSPLSAETPQTLHQLQQAQVTYGQVQPYAYAHYEQPAAPVPVNVPLTPANLNTKAAVFIPSKIVSDMELEPIREERSDEYQKM